MQKWLLLDNQSTTDIFCNKTLLTGIRKVPMTMNLKTNGGTLKCQEMGHLPNYGDVWYHKDAITNILSLKNMKEKNYKINYDSMTGNMFTVSRGDTVLRFRASPEGLYHVDLEKDEVALINSVKENESFYTARQIARAKAARKLYETIGTPSVRDFKTII